MSPLDRISLNQGVRFGKPCVRGTRITVGNVLSYLAAGMTEDQVLAEFTQLTREDIRACLAYAAERERRSVTLAFTDPARCEMTSSAMRPASRPMAHGSTPP